jgi:hypothetical protein
MMDILDLVSSLALSTRRPHHYKQSRFRVVLDLALAA